mmetsp:Transcript_53764/g.60061  ORF Transcript_53764/g.60061 Transcript_53764/m.60061 type:complete len:313 (+) Transcript_53764:3-941(+)
MTTTDDDDDYNNDEEAGESSLERAIADLEIIQSCYPDEIHDSSSSLKFPFQFTLQLSDQCSLTLKLEPGYPVLTGVQIATYQTNKAQDKACLEAVVRAVRKVSFECQEEGMEGSIGCCSIALEIWNDHHNNDDDNGDNESLPPTSLDSNTENYDEVVNHTAFYEWISGEPLLDKKSSFQAHLCQVYSESEVQESLHQLLTSSSKIQRASHNMYAWRINESMSDGRTVIKHDNDDDGEALAGRKLAFLLDTRKDTNVLVVVSRWFGGIHLGPKRFAHIVNVSRKLLVEYNNNVIRVVGSSSNDKMNRSNKKIK